MGYDGETIADKESPQNVEKGYASRVYLIENSL
jgi:hypothetical protein